MTPRATVAILSHRPEFVTQAMASAMAQTVPCQVVVQFDRQAWGSKLNDIMAAARGTFVVILCDDDLLDPRFVERCLFVARDADLVYTDRQIFHDGQAPDAGEWARYHSNVPIDVDGVKITIPPGSFAFGSPLPMTCLIRRSWWVKMNGYDDVPHADTEFWYRSVAAGARVVYVPQPLFQYRQHAGQSHRQSPTTPVALEAFHRKHIAAFGFDYGNKTVDGDKWTIPMLSPFRRSLRRLQMLFGAWA